MDAVQDFEDMLELLQKHQAQYLIIGGVAFIYHAKPRYTKDMDLWIGPDDEIDQPKHQEDARILREVKMLKEGSERSVSERLVPNLLSSRRW